MKYTVEINYGGHVTQEVYKSKKAVDRRFYGWYVHGLDMSGQISSTFVARDDAGKIIIKDSF